jgi:PEP-CTERM motif
MFIRGKRPMNFRKKNTVRVLSIIAGVFAMAAPLSATPIFTINTSIVGNTVQGSVYFSSSAGANIFDVRGMTELDVANPNPVGSLLLYDVVMGTDNDFSIAPNSPNYLAFQNNQLFAVNVPDAVNPTTDQLEAMFFNLFNPVITSSKLTFDAIGIAITPNPAIDPVKELTGVLSFNFNLTKSTDLPNGDRLSTFTLASVTAVPEPATLTMLVLGSILLVAASRRRSLLFLRQKR